MSETKFTPGPWEYDKYHQLLGSNGKSICTYNSGMSHLLTNSDEEANANTLVMKAAPEMYEELQECASLLNFLVDHLEGRMGPGALTDMHLKAESAFEVLAKARGESND